jgi:hypothetical protein
MDVREAEGYKINVSPLATAMALVVDTFMNTALVNTAPTGIASMRVYKPRTGLTAARSACAMDWGIFTNAKVKPASRSDERFFFSGLIFRTASVLFTVHQ